MSMIQESLLQYLLWLRERGQCWPSKYQELLAEVSEDVSEEVASNSLPEAPVDQIETTAAVPELTETVPMVTPEPDLNPPLSAFASEPINDIESDHNSEPSERVESKPDRVLTAATKPVVAPAEKFNRSRPTAEISTHDLPQAIINPELLRTAGNKNAPVIFITDSIQSQPMVFGCERELLLKLLSAIGLKPGQDMQLVTLNTNEQCEPLADEQAYRQAWKGLSEQTRPKFVLILGSLAYRLISSGSYENYLSHLNSWITSNTGQVRYLILPHLSEFVTQTSLKKASWPLLQELKHWVQTS